MDLDKLIEPAIRGGAQVACICVLFWVWWAIKSYKQAADAETKLKLLRLTMIFSAFIIVMSGAIELCTKHMDSQKNKDALIASMVQLGQKALLNSLFEPQQIKGHGVYSYLDRAPNGFLCEVEKDSIFQDFSTDHLVQRLWADPRYTDSFIRAVQLSERGKGLSIDFVRRGWGCDVTIKQRYNKTALTEGYNTLA